eukprot:m.152756 g.152756  ORF g.152756 m.152756 type:complete len:86 (+) comp15110_c0_seq2:209-466(+)
MRLPNMKHYHKPSLTTGAASSRCTCSSSSTSSSSTFVGRLKQQSQAAIFSNTSTHGTCSTHSISAIISSSTEIPSTSLTASISWR